MNEIDAVISTAIGLTEQIIALTEITKPANVRLIIEGLQIQLALIKMKSADLVEENIALNR